jgi:hypothetical protein
MAVFLGPMGMGRWQQREKELGLDRQAHDPNFGVIPVLLAGADPALGFLKVNTWVDLRARLAAENIEILARAARGEPPSADLRAQIADTLAGICPYRGLQPFREEDAQRRRLPTCRRCPKRRPWPASHPVQRQTNSSTRTYYIDAELIPELRNAPTYDFCRLHFPILPSVPSSAGPEAPPKELTRWFAPA